MAVFSAGCFWGVQKAFDEVLGVLETTVGYAGGTVQNPSYEQVCSGKTGHAEAIRIVFNPNKISFEQLLKVFFKIHDSTQLNRQGPDVGHQYRSAIFFKSERQRETAEKVVNEVQKRFSKPIATEINQFSNFFPAEDYHQKYYVTHPGVC